MGCRQGRDPSRAPTGTDSQDTHGTSAWRRDALPAAIAIWVAAFAVVIGLLLGGHIKTVSYRVYEAAGRRWLESAPLYDTSDIENFQYLPQSAMLAAPFAWLGRPYGDVAWRLLFWALYAAGTWRLAKALAPARAPEVFLLATVIAVGPGTGPLGNGQANLAMAGFMMNAAADVIAERWRRATLVLVLGLAVKPLMAVLALLVWATHRPLRWLLPAATVLMLLVPWAVKDHAYVVAQYEACLAKMSMSLGPAGLYEDLRGLLTSLGWQVSQSVYLVVRVLAGFAVLALCVHVRARLREPYASVLTLALASAYLMLFNPRTQSTSYVMTACVAALLAATWVIERNWRMAATMTALVLGWSVNYHVVSSVEFWLKPLVCLAFVAVLVRQILAPAPGWLRPAG